MAGKYGPRIFHAGPALDVRLEQIARECDRPDAHRRDRRAHPRQSEEGGDTQDDESARAGSGDRSFPGLPGADARRDASSSKRRADDVGGDVGGPRGEDREDEPDGKLTGRAVVCSERAQLFERAKTREADEEQGSEHEAYSAAAKREELGESENPTRHQQDPEHDRRREDPDEDHRRVDRRGHRALPKISHQRPKRRSRFAYDSRAASRSVTEKSGHRTCVAHISEYATSQSRKFETRSSPPVRIRRSGSGWSGA